MAYVVRVVTRSVIRLPLELVRLLILLIRLLFCFLLSLILFLIGRPWRRVCASPRDPKRCPDEIPPHLRRKPDPCLYSQFFLMQQNIPVTWDNPDIFLTELDGTPVPSSQLQADHTYIVNGRIWDASFDPALGVEVRCYFHDWGFNGARVPVELNANGTERVVLLNIAPWSNATAQFNWTTPAGGGHFCLKVECYHPDDKNPANNVGQENTDVLRGSPGQQLAVMARLVNPLQHATRVRLTADTYQIPDREWEFNLVTHIREIGGPIVSDGKERRNRFRQWLFGTRGREPRNIRYDYIGRAELLAAQRAVPSGIPAGWDVRADGQSIDRPVELAAGESRDVELAVQIPNTARPGDELTFNFNATDPSRGPLGGVTVTVRVQ